MFIISLYLTKLYVTYSKIRQNFSNRVECLHDIETNLKPQFTSGSRIGLLDGKINNLVIQFL